MIAIQKRYKKIIIFCLVMGLLLATLIITNASDESAYSLLGKLFGDKVTPNAESGRILAEIGNQKITQEAIDFRKVQYEVLGVQKTEDEIFRQMATELLLLEEAKKNNVTVSEEFVNEQLENQMTLLKEDKQAYKDFQDFIMSAGMTEQEYIEKARSVHEKHLIIGAYKKQVLLQLFKENNPNIPDKDINEEFEKFYLEYKNDLFEKSNITYAK